MINSVDFSGILYLSFVLYWHETLSTGLIEWICIWESGSAWWDFVYEFEYCKLNMLKVLILSVVESNVRESDYACCISFALH